MLACTDLKRSRSAVVSFVKLVSKEYARLLSIALVELCKGQQCPSLMLGSIDSCLKLTDTTVILSVAAHLSGAIQDDPKNLISDSYRPRPIAASSCGPCMHFSMSAPSIVVPALLLLRTVIHEASCSRDCCSQACYSQGSC